MATGFAHIIPMLHSIQKPLQTLASAGTQTELPGIIEKEAERKAKEEWAKHERLQRNKWLVSIFVLILIGTGVYFLTISGLVQEKDSALATVEKRDRTIDQLQKDYFVELSDVTPDTLKVYSFLFSEQPEIKPPEITTASLEYFDELSDAAALYNWPSDGTRLRAGRNEDRTDVNGHAGYATSLLQRVKDKAGEINAALEAQGTFKHTSQFAKDTSLMQILTAFPTVAAHMDAQWARHLEGKTVGIIDGDGRRLIDQATGGLFAHMKSYRNALDGNRIGELEGPETDLPADVSDITADTLKVNSFLFPLVPAM